MRKDNPGGTGGDRTIPPVRKSIEVGRASADAYAFFTERFSDWWPAEKHSVSAMRDGASPVRLVLEAKAGGRIFETDGQGLEIEWGVVQVAEPGVRLVLSWYPGLAADQATEVEFRFVATGASSCRVELEHRGWHRLAEKGQTTRDGYDRGWDSVIGRLSSAIQAG